MYRCIASMAAVALMLIVATLTTPVMALPRAHSRFTQEIKFTDCTTTAVQDGSGEARDTRCDKAIVPTVVSITSVSGRPTIKGTFDAQSTSELRVFAAGRWYTLGIDSELTASGNTWQLDLSDRMSLPEGTYNIVVEVITTEGLLLRDRTDEELVVVTPSPDQPTSPRAPDSGRPSFGLMFLSSGISGAIAAILLMMQHKASCARSKNDIISRKQNRGQ